MGDGSARDVGGDGVADRDAVRPQSRAKGARVAIIATLALFLVACAPASTSVAAPAVDGNEPTCPIEAFDVFIERFARDIAFQELATANPLVIERYDTAAEPEPRRIEEEIAVADIVWPVMPRLDSDGDGVRTHAIAAVADGRMEVQVRRADTSDQQRYVFGRSPCWQLQRVIDDSI